MHNENAWIYGPTGLPVENIAAHSQPTLRMSAVQPSRRRWRRLLQRLLIAFGLLFLLLAGACVFFWYNPAALGWVGEPLLVPQPNAAPWNGSDPINILAMGVDQRLPGEKTHSDTMLIISITPATKQVRLVSIPRDLAVTVPGYGALSKINEGYYLGGPRYAALTVEHSLGIPINYYAVLRFNSFRHLIDALGGVDMTVDRDINDPTFPCDVGTCYSPFVIGAGPHHMDGATALRYVRERHVYTYQQDLARIRHQQQLITAIKSELLSVHTLLHLPSIVAALRATLNTDLPDNMLPVVAMLLLQDRNIEHVYLDDKSGLVRQCVGGDMGADLCPIEPAFGSTLAHLFHNQQLADEHAGVWVQNGTASSINVVRASALLRACQFNLVGDGPADNSNHAHTAIVVNSARPPAPYTTRLLRQMFDARLITRNMPDVPAQVVVLIGNDMAQVQP